MEILSHPYPHILNTIEPPPPPPHLTGVKWKFCLTPAPIF